ncbi:MAG TPA: hypothetical protein VF875_13435 [Anaeromyxobacter sp.]
MNALFQGDVIVVPELAHRDRDPRIVTRELRKRICKVCQKKVEDKRLCDHCQAQLPAPDKNELKITGLKDRQAAQEDVFAKTPEVLANLKSVAVMIESHGCDIDRQGDISVWQIRPLTALSREQQESVKMGDNGSLMFLEPVGQLPPCAIDFNASFTVPAWVLGEGRKYRSARRGGAEENALIPFQEVFDQRLASLSQAGLKRLWEFKIRHLTRFEFELDAPDLEEDDPSRPGAPLPSRPWRLPYPKWIAASNS